MYKQTKYPSFGQILLFATTFSAGFICHAATTKVQMRIVEETANYGSYPNHAGDIDLQTPLVAQVKPANFSGPLLFKKIIGHCYNASVDRYQYVLCPFQNATQHEQSVRWNAYQGVLGVWSHWKIKNNSFVSMMYIGGDSCGNVDRSIEVFLQCGPKNMLTNVTEPERCQYSANFITKFVCHEDSLLVYPRLDPQFQNRWDVLWTEYNKQGFITERGYDIGVQSLLNEAGLTKPIKIAKKTVENAGNITSSLQMTDLETCNEEYEKLKEEIAQLKQENESLKILRELNVMMNKTRKNSPK